MIRDITDVTFLQKKDKGCKSKKIFKCKHCGQQIIEKEIILFAGYNICPYCRCECK